MPAAARNITVSRLSERLQTDTSPVELRDLATAFNGMLSRLEDSFRRLSEFSSAIAHELRTPIANMMTQTPVALSRTRTADECREVLYSNAEEFDRLARMISDMPFLAKADHGLIVPQSEPIELATEVRDLFEFYDALADDQGIKLALAGQGEVSGDRLMIRRVVSNLLSNAINHTPRGGQVNVRIQRAGSGVVRLLVESPGEGIAPQHLLRIFDRFYRVDPSRQRSTDGAGLGLAIARSIVTAHNGTVRAFSADGLTRFEILLPLRKPTRVSGLDGQTCPADCRSACPGTSRNPLVRHPWQGPLSRLRIDCQLVTLASSAWRPRGRFVVPCGARRKEKEKERRKEMHAGMSMMNRMHGGAMMGGMGTGVMGQ
jgi:two-component system heavy metal sensor histidine kinase CusS